MSARRVGWVAAVALVALVLSFSTGAGAQDDGYEGDGTLICTPTTVQAGQDVTCTLTGCNTGATATFFLNGNQVATGVSTSPVTVTFPIPPGTPPGVVQISAMCDEGRAASASDDPRHARGYAPPRSHHADTFELSGSSYR